MSSVFLPFWKNVVSNMSLYVMQCQLYNVYSLTVSSLGFNKCRMQNAECTVKVNLPLANFPYRLRSKHIACKAHIAFHLEYIALSQTTYRA